MIDDDPNWTYKKWCYVSVSILSTIVCTFNFSLYTFFLFLKFFWTTEQLTTSAAVNHDIDPTVPWDLQKHVWWKI